MQKSGYIITVYVGFIVLSALVGIYAVSGYIANKDGLYISEVCSHNNGVIYDSVGFYHDYIELTNAGEDDIDLRGYGLSDDNSLLMKYTFPSTVLRSGQKMIIWADTPSVYYGSAGAEYEDDESLYTEFSLRDHESLYLTSPEGYVIDSLRLPAMKDDMALIRTNRNDKGKVSTPKEISIPAPTVSESIISPGLSVPSGWYEDPFELAIEGYGNEVLFTVDGSNPSIYGKKYAEPIRIFDKSKEPNSYANLGPVSNVYKQEIIPPVSKAFVVRSVSKSESGVFSKETVATYFVGDEIHDIIMDSYILSIVSDPEGLFSYRNGIYVPGAIWDMNKNKAIEGNTDLRYAPTGYNMRGKHWRRNARIMLFDKNSKCLYDENTTINIRGGTSRAMLQKSFAIKPQMEGQRVFDGLISVSGDAFDLRTGGEDEAFLTNFRDTLNSEIARDLNIGTQKSICCQVYLDGEYWGCYNLLDHLNTAFISNRYDVPADNINLIKNYEVTSGLDTDYKQYQELDEYVKNNDFAVSENYNAFCEMVDIDSLIDYYCAEIFFANSDAYINNIAIWRSRTSGSGQYEDCRWRFILFDTDESDSIFEDWAEKDTFVSGNWMGCNPDVELYFSNLSKNTEFRKKFYNRFMQLLENDFSYERIEPIITMFEEKYSEPMVRSIRRFGVSDFTDEQYAQNVEIVRDFFKRRGAYVEKYLVQHMGE